MGKQPLTITYYWYERKKFLNKLVTWVNQAERSEIKNKKNKKIEFIIPLLFMVNWRLVLFLSWRIKKMYPITSIFH
jgi:hypothetical protein